VGSSADVERGPVEPRIDGAGLDGAAGERIRRRRGGELRPLDELLLHSPPVADGWNSLLGAIRADTTLTPKHRELAVLRVAVLNGAEYEWWAHAPVAADVGVSSQQLAAVRRDVTSPVFDAAERAVLAYTDVMTRDVAVPDMVFDAVAAHLDVRQVVELTATIAVYNMVSRFLVALELAPPVGHWDGEGGREIG
jgi:4-carboxymuconolactone decarboxylase